MKNKNHQTIKNEDVYFPKESSLVIEKILEKHNLKIVQKQALQKLSNSFLSIEERGKIFKNLPGAKISQLVRDYAENKVSLERMPLILEKELAVSTEKAEQIVEELQKNILIFIKPTKKETAWKKVSTKSKLPLPVSERPKSPPTKDRYREVIE